jgi:hypothetical protein
MNDSESVVLSLKKKLVVMRAAARVPWRFEALDRSDRRLFLVLDDTPEGPFRRLDTFGHRPKRIGLGSKPSLIQLRS